MIDRLPYKLTEGVTATREGLVMNPALGLHWVIGFEVTCITRAIENESADVIIYWPDAAKRILYHKGEPGVFTLPTYTEAIVCFTRTKVIEGTITGAITLHRLAAILCDDAEAFRMLHWCVNNLGGAGWL